MPKTTNTETGFKPTVAIATRKDSTRLQRETESQARHEAAKRANSALDAEIKRRLWNEIEESEETISLTKELQELQFQIDKLDAAKTRLLMRLSACVLSDHAKAIAKHV